MSKRLIEDELDRVRDAKHIPIDRKIMPVFSGLIEYFPNALLEISHCSKVGNDQHHPDKPLHWDKNKSNDHLDALTRHLIDHSRCFLDTDGILHLTKVAWRALAALEIQLTESRDDKNIR